MTSWPDQPADGQPPQTRRQARESERTAARQESRRVGTADPTPGGEIPDFSTPKTAAPQSAAPSATERPTIPATAFAEPGVLPPSRPTASSGGGFDSLLFSGLASPEAGDQDGTPAELFRQAADPTKPEAVTQPLTVVPPSAAPDSSAAPERTLTRREMRAMMQAQEANQQANHTPHLAEPVVPISFGAEAAAPVDVPAAPEKTDDGKSAWPFAPLTPSTPGRAAKDSTASAFVSTPAGQPVEMSSPVTPFASAGLAPTPAPAGAPTAEDDIDPSLERRPFTPPTGHWSTAAEVEDASEPIITRNVGQSTAATTTNALILPSIPRPDATAPLTSTGEILVTGSIDLPRGLGSTGLNPEHLDSSDIDSLLDGEENEFNTSEVAPVRASRAISTHTSTRGVITPPKKRGNALPTVLIITAGVLAVGVIGLLVAAYWLKVF